jgi:drug/metabolite transporter (DMT)-like permease
MDRTRRQHAIAIIVIALVAIFFGCGFAAMQGVLHGGMSVGTAISVRFVTGAIVLMILLKSQRVHFDRQSIRDGLVLGALLVSIFWLQTDGLRFTTTAKSGLITSLYVPFTPMLAFFLRDRVKFAHGLGALIATLGLYLLVHVPGDLWSGWNRGDIETLACAVLCTFHVTYTARFSRRSNAWILAWTQVAVTGVLSAIITGLLPSPHGFQTAWAALHRSDVLIAMLFMICFTTVFGFWGISKMQGYLSATEAAVVYSFEPVVAWLVGLLWVRESFLQSQMVGAGLILLAVLTAELLPRAVAKFRADEIAGAPAD